MAKSFMVHGGDRVFLLAAAVAVSAAIFLVTVWAPMQVRSFETAAGPKAAPESGFPGWERVPFTTADGRLASLWESNGRVRIVTMMYAHCPGVCPMAVSSLQALEKRLSAQQRAKLSIVALSLDPERDSIAALREFRSARGIGEGWILGRPSVEGARRLAAGLGVDFRVLADGTVDHQSLFVLLGPDGRVLARSNARSPDPRFQNALRHALAGT